MSRVGWSSRHMSRKRRLQITRNVVIEQTAKSANHRTTMADVARRMGLSPSSYVMGLLDDLWEMGEIEGDTNLNSRRNVVYYWWCDRMEQLPLPFEPYELSDAAKEYSGPIPF